MKLNRACGILLHPTSLPSNYGIGELGQEAYDFLDFLALSKQKLWQILPLNPPGFGDSPYQALSAFAGNPWLISIEKLREDGLLEKKDVQDVPAFPENKVNFPLMKDFKQKLFLRAFQSFKDIKPSGDYCDFLLSSRYWLYDYAFFMALKNYYGGSPWNLWEQSLVLRKPRSYTVLEEQLAEEIRYYLFLQFQFHKQWHAVKKYAEDKGITIIGDLPLFISYDSSDTWVNRHLFELDAKGYPAKVAGVPPDYFSKTGQLWGNPHYRWRLMALDSYYWWQQRFIKLLEMVHVIRIDHFRGFQAYWEILAGEETAIKGKWKKGPGARFFSVMQEKLGELPVIAEDLGYITPDVIALKDRLAYPGMKVLQFLNTESLLNRVAEECVVFYTGTHDNDTLWGWYQAKVGQELENKAKVSPLHICWDFIQILLRSRAQWVIIPLQDVLGLDSWARMNTPGTIGSNWQWRFSKNSLTKDVENKLARLVENYGRI